MDVCELVGPDLMTIPFSPKKPAGSGACVRLRTDCAWSSRVPRHPEPFAGRQTLSHGGRRPADEAEEGGKGARRSLKGVHGSWLRG